MPRFLVEFTRNFHSFLYTKIHQYAKQSFMTEIFKSKHLTVPLAKPLIKVVKMSAWQNEGGKKIGIRDGEQVEKPVHSNARLYHGYSPLFPSFCSEGLFSLILAPLQRISAPLHLPSLLPDDRKVHLSCQK